MPPHIALLYKIQGVELYHKGFQAFMKILPTGGRPGQETGKSMGLMKVQYRRETFPKVQKALYGISWPYYYNPPSRRQVP